MLDTGGGVRMRFKLKYSSKSLTVQGALWKRRG